MEQERKRKNPALKTCLLFFVMLFCCLRLPLEAEIKGHDLSAEAALEFWSKNNYQYGTEIMPNTGPLGFINYPDVYTGFLDKEKLIINFGMLCIFMGLLFYLTEKIPDRFARRLLLFNTAVFAFITYIPFRAGKLDTSFYLFLLFTGYALLQSKSAWSLALFALLAVFSMTKGTLMMLSLCVIFLVIVFYIASRRYLHAALAPLIYGVSFTLLWVLCNQDIANLPHYLDRMLGLRDGYAAGYNEAMALFEDELMTFVGVTILFCSAATILWRNLQGEVFSHPRLLIQRSCCLGIELLILFVVWKHSYVRTGENLGSYFRYCLVAFPLFYWLPVLQAASLAEEKVARKAQRFREMISLYYISMFICIAFMIVQAKVMTIPPALLNAYVLSDPETIGRKIELAFEETKAKNALPLTQKLVGNEKMGHFGNELMLLIYNNFRYTPMPRIVPFTSWNHATMEADAKFYRDPETAPAYVLYKQETIDEKLMGQESALAQLEIFRWYDLVNDPAIRAETKDYLLMKRRGSAQELIRTSIAPERHVKMLEWVSVPQSALPVRMKVRIEPTLTAQVLGFFYKRPEYLIHIKLNNGQNDIKRLIPISMREGVLVAPYVRNNIDITNIFDHDEYTRFAVGEPSSLRKITEFRIGCRFMEFACTDSFDVEFETVNGLDLGRMHKD